MAVVQEFLTVIVNALSMLVGNFATSINTGIGSLFMGAENTLTDGGYLLAMAVGIACAIGLVRIAWNFFANIGHR